MHRLETIMSGENTILMCKNRPVYNITTDVVLCPNLLPGGMLKGNLDYNKWMESRYSSRSNAMARKLMTWVMGTDCHGAFKKKTRALSLSDCYWLKEEHEEVDFYKITPYLNKDWNGAGMYEGGPIATIFTNGASSKRWDSAKTLRKFSVPQEIEVYKLLNRLDIQVIPKVSFEGDDLLVTNFTNTGVFLEDMYQSGMLEQGESLEKAVLMFKEKMVVLLALDYITENGNRSLQNFGVLRDSDTGEYLVMSPYYDFSWSFCGKTSEMPDNVVKQYKHLIINLCEQATYAAVGLKHEETMVKRAKQLTSICTR